MNKKFLSAILFGALMVSSTGTFVSCKDYDDDIDQINKELTDIKSAISELQAKVGTGKFVTNIVKEGEGIKITWNDNSTSTIETIKGADGATGAAGKAGTLVTIIDGYWAFDGVKSTYPAKGEQGIQGEPGKDGAAAAAGHDAKISEDGYWMVWDATANSGKGDWKETEYIAGGATAVQVKGGWNLTVRDESGNTQTIFIPSSAVMGAMEVWNMDEMFALYGINAADVAYSPYNKTLKKGLYTTLDRDLKVVVNPQGTDASLYFYKMENTEGTNTDLLFKEAIPFKGLLAARATSSNGVWVLPHDYQFYTNDKLDDIRTNLYLRFKSNDGKAHALSLTATLDETTIKTPYDLEATLREIDAADIKAHIGIKNIDKCYINTLYSPVYTDTSKDSTAVYDYWLTLEQSTQNLKNAAMFGVEIPDSEKGHSFRYTKQAGVYNPVKFAYNYILMNGTVVSGSAAPVFSAYLTDEMATSGSITMPDYITPFDAKIASALVNRPNNATAISTLGKMFGLSKEYDLANLVNGMDTYTKLVWNNALTPASIALGSIEATLIGGEGDNNAQWVNERLLKNIRFSFNSANNKLTVQFLVSDKWSDIGSTSNLTVATTNFKLNNAYKLTLKVKDEQALNTVATIEMPFEFTQPTLDITRANGKFTQWSGTNLFAYGPMCDDNDHTMHLPLYDSFNAWKSTTPAYIQYVDNAEYYKMTFTNSNSNVYPWGVLAASPAAPQTVALDNALDYNAVYHQLRTLVDKAAIDVAVGTQSEITVPMDVDYKYYGVYASNEVDFNLVYASWLKHSTLAMQQASYSTERGTHIVFLDNDDINFKTPKGDAFYLFDDSDASGNIVERKTKNGNSFNENEQHPFTTFNAANASTISWSTKIFTSGLFASDDAHFTAKQADGAQAAVSVATSVVLTSSADFDLNTVTGDLTLKPASIVEDATKVKIYQVPCIAATANTAVATGIQKAYRGGMIIQLPTSIQDNQSVIVTVTLKDYWGYTNTFNITVKKLN